MRVIRGVILLGVLCAGCEAGSVPTPDPSETTTAPPPTTTPPACPTNQPVTVTFDENDDKKCEIDTVEPDNVLVCDKTERITWTYINNCERKLQVKIGKDRRRKYGKFANKIDPLVPGSGDFETLKPLDVGGSVTAYASVKPKTAVPSVPNGLYKYDLEGKNHLNHDWKVDPEIDVRR